MGKEWYWGGTGRSSKRSGRTETEIPSGCMCAIFQAFDFHPFHFSINQEQQPSFNSATSHISEHHSVPKGAEAPRNSLESDDGTLSSISKEENFKIPKKIRIKTSGSTRERSGNLSDFSSEISSSPGGTKTPTLVARLMGLELLPDSHSTPSFSSCLSTPNQQGLSQNRPKQNIQILKHRKSTGSASDNVIAIRSLPETPRLSLQINKENLGLGDDFEVPRLSFSKRKYDENSSNRSPSHYARQIVKQVKESVSRKVGLDITNTVKNREQRKDQELVSQVKFKKNPKQLSLDESSPGKNSNQSYSPRLSRFGDTNKHKENTKSSKENTKSSQIAPKDHNTNQILKPPSPPPVVKIEAELSSRVLTKPKSQILQEKELLQNQKTVSKCKKTSHGKVNSRLNKPPQTSIRNKQEESFITRPPSAARANDIKTKSKKTHPLSNNLLPVKTGHSPQKQPQVISCSRQTQTLAIGGTIEDTTGTEYQYITTILSRTGIHRATLPNLQFQWFSSTHPLDPSIFHRLEHYPPSNLSISFPEINKDSNFSQKYLLGPRCNRRLLFDLVDELLSEILVRPKGYRGFLVERVWEKVRRFPRAKCEVMEDIDRFVEMEEMKEEEEGEGLVTEIEGKIMDWLVHETITVMVG